MRFIGNTKSELFAQDFTAEQLRDFTIRREIIWESENSPQSMLDQKEMEFIEEYNSRDPTTGYN
jgi:hypothetical protein